MEYGVTAELPIYSGGLGILAGDHIKSAGDLGQPLVGIGLLWDEGYSRQRIVDGKPEDFFVTTPREHLTALDTQLSVRIENHDVVCRAYAFKWRSAAPIYLLEPVEAEHRWMTKRLYGGDKRARVAQEMLLGIGGIRLMRALGHHVDVFHFNEGHAVFAALELIREQMATGADFRTAVKNVKNVVVFTTHTPVPAGNEEHSLSSLTKMGANVELTNKQLEQLGGSPFSMTAAGLRLSRAANAVAKLHAETARKMWRDVEGGSEIFPITNGVHPPTWQIEGIREANIDLTWQLHCRHKRQLLKTIREATNTAIPSETLVIGFARRAATYKRGDLILSDPDRFDKLVGDGSVVLVFAGKAHPADKAGKAVIASINEAARRWPRSVVFLEDYDMRLGRLLTSGCDVWLNNPRRPKEACGTSGMKAAMNGVLNLSILDGWWPEGCRHGETGWQIRAKDVPPGATQEQQDDADRSELFRVLEDEVLPTFSNRQRWCQMMRASIEMSEYFSSDRMVNEYFEKLYAPAM